MRPEVEIYDTTLRDGSQGEGINFSAADKLRIAEKLDAFGVHYIEGGWPGSNPKDMEFFAQARRRKWRNARIAAFSMTRRKAMAVENDTLMHQILEAESFEEFRVEFPRRDDDGELVAIEVAREHRDAARMHGDPAIFVSQPDAHHRGVALVVNRLSDHDS